MHEFRSADERSERAELFGQREKDFILVVNRLCQERYQLAPRPLDAQREGDRRQLLDGIET